VKPALAGAIATVFLCFAAAAPAADLTIDPNRSHAEFSVRLLWVKHISGTFRQMRGEVTLNHEASTARVDAWIDTVGLEMESARLRRWVMAPEFFDAEHYPQIHFVSEPTPLAALTDGGKLNGKLTIRGITQPASFDLQPVACDTRYLSHCELQVRGNIDRTDFGMSGRRGALSDRVYLGMVIGFAPQDPHR
jgi:polyisoprenoid-binding protein YceI